MVRYILEINKYETGETPTPIYTLPFDWSRFNTTPPPVLTLNANNSSPMQTASTPSSETPTTTPIQPGLTEFATNLQVMSGGRRRPTIITQNSSTFIIGSRGTIIDESFSTSTSTEQTTLTGVTTTTPSTTMNVDEQTDTTLRLITNNNFNNHITPKILFVNQADENGKPTVLQTTVDSDRLVLPSVVVTTVENGTAKPATVNFDGEAFTLTKSVTMSDKLGKVVGLAYSNKQLFVASHQNGKIVVLSTPDLREVRTIECKECQIYDIAILSTGELIVAQGARKRITKLNPITGEVTAETQTTYSTKGVTIGDNDEIFVLSRSHDTVYKYNSQLTELAQIKFENEQQDCNFIIVRPNIVYLGCEDVVRVIDFTGSTLAKLQPPRDTHFQVYSYAPHIHR